MNFLEYYELELNNPKTQYFIIDTHDSNGENDFITYQWDTHRYNLVNSGDLFLYRRPQRASEIKDEFYFFGAGKFGDVECIKGSNVLSRIIKPLYFNNYLLKRDLNNFVWDFKDRKKILGSIFLINME